VNAQDYVFSVVVNKGTSEVNRGGTWSPIKAGDKLTGNDEVKVAANCYLGLVHKSGKPIEIKSPGSYKISQLEKNVNTNAGGLSKYTDFVLSSNTEKKNTLQATGAVVRGQSEIKVFVPESQMAIIYNHRITLSWDNAKHKGPYTVYLNSMFGDDLMKVDVETNQLTIDLSDKAFKNEDNILVIVLPKGQEKNPSIEGQMIKRMSKADRERIEPQIKEVASSLTEENAMNKVYLAGAYEKNKLLVDAGSAYLEAIRLEPGVDSFKELYEAFLIRNGLNAPKE
jgi:hypothetical protein